MSDMTFELQSFYKITVTAKIDLQDLHFAHEKLHCNFEDQILCSFRWTNEIFLQ